MCEYDNDGNDNKNKKNVFFSVYTYIKITQAANALCRAPNATAANTYSSFTSACENLDVFKSALVLGFFFIFCHNVNFGIISGIKTAKTQPAEHSKIVFIWRNVNSRSHVNMKNH